MEPSRPLSPAPLSSEDTYLTAAQWLMSMGAQEEDISALSTAGGSGKC